MQLSDEFLQQDRSDDNMVERLNGTVRERNKVMRGMKDKETANTIMDGQRIYYNFIRPHQALDGNTPAQEAKMDLQLENNKWLSLVERASKAQ